MNVSDILSACRAHGIVLSVKGDKLRVTARDKKIPSDIEQLLRAHKTQIVQTLTALSGDKSAAQPIKPRGEGSVPLSFTQQRLWFLYQLEGANTAYNIFHAYRLDSQVNAQVLCQALAPLLQRHESFRTHFAEVDGQAVQLIADEVKAPQLEMVESYGQLAQIYRQERSYPFKLDEPGLCRIRLLHLPQSDSQPEALVLLLCFHHSIYDGLSHDILLKELNVLYAAFSQNQPSPLATPAIQYGDFALWQRSWADSDDFNHQLEYWTGQLKGMPQLLNLPADRPRPAEQRSIGAVENFVIDTAMTERLNRFSQSHGVSLYVTLLSLVQVLLHRYSGQDDFAIGTPVAGRGHHQTKDLIGFLANTQVMRCRLEENPSFLQLLEQNRQNALDAMKHQDLPFERLVDEFCQDRSLSYSPLVQVMFSYSPENNPSQVGHGLNLSPYVPEGLAKASIHSRFDVFFGIKHHQSRLIGQLEYNCDLYDAERIVAMIRCLERLCVAVLELPNGRVSDLSLLDSADQQQLLAGLNQTDIAYSSNTTIDVLFEQQVTRTPNAIALSYAGQQLSYADLDQMSNSLAHKLVGAGVGPECGVGLCLYRSVEMVVAILAVVKAGGYYVPFDPELPAARLAYMLQSSGIGVVVSLPEVAQACELEALVQAQEPSSVSLMLLDALGYAATGPMKTATANNLAYAIYTSGSTGQPKGAGISHQALINRLDWMQNQYGLSSQDKILQKTPFSFDVSVWEFFWPLLQGACLVVAEPGVHKDPDALAEVISNQRITRLHFVPSMLNAFLAVNGWRGCESVQQVFCSGEALSLPLKQRFLRLSGNCRLENLYGPTEAAIDVSYFPCRAGDSQAKVPIGKPIQNIQLFIVDHNFNVVPFGVVGELLICGDGLARGYLGKGGLTAERFIPNPFAKTPGERAYRTGDLVRLLSDGNIDYVGRDDHQLKLRGLRIELGEINAALSGLAGIEQAVVKPCGSGDNTRLAGFIKLDLNTLEQGLEQGSKEAVLRHFELKLGELLPEYMVPSAWVVVEQFSLTSSGKVDLKALPEPSIEQKPSVHVAPGNEVEQALADIVGELLQRQKVSVDDNFFAIGGDSILSIQLVAKARERGMRLNVRQIFKQSNIRGLAKLIEAQQRKEEETSTQYISQGSMPLLPVHHWFFDVDHSQSAHFHQSVLLSTPENCDRAFLSGWLTELYRRHDALRLVYCCKEQRWQGLFQAFSPAVVAQSLIELELDGSQGGLAQQIKRNGEQIKAEFSLEKGPLFKAVYFKTQDPQQNRLLLIGHHLVVDGVSWRVLLEDINTRFAQRQDGIKAAAYKTTGYQQFAELLNGLKDEPSLLAQKDYWLTQLAKSDLSLCVDNPLATSDLEGQAQRFIFSLGESATEQLLTQAAQTYRSGVQPLLLAALQLAFYRSFGVRRLTLDVESHGREHHWFDDVDLSETLGWFTAIYPLSFELSEPSSDEDGFFKNLIVNCKETVRSVPDNGLGYGILRYLAKEPQLVAIAQTHQPEVMFNYLGQFQRQTHNDNPFKPVQGDSGSDVSALRHRSHWLSINSSITQGDLRIAVDYHPHRHSLQSIEKLCGAFTQALSEIIEHCRHQQRVCFSASDFSGVKLDQTTIDKYQQRYPALQDIYPATGMQLGLMFHSLLNTTEDVYASQMYFDFCGDFDKDLFKACWQALIERHDVLRTAFADYDGDQALQLLLEKVDLPWQELDWSELTTQQQDSAYDQLLLEDKQQHFDFAKPPLMRMYLVHLGEAKVRWHWTYHHTLLDGWSLQTVLSDLFGLYQSADPQGFANAPSAPNFKSYVNWLHEQDRQEAENYWRQTLKAFDGKTSLSIESAKVSRQQSQEQVAHKNLTLEVNVTEQLKAQAKTLGVTVNILLQAAWAYLLHRYSGQKQVIFGQTTSGRGVDVVGIEQMVGLFINTLPVCVEVDSSLTVAQFIAQLHQAQIDREEHGFIPLAQIQRLSDTERKGPLFDSLIVFQNYPVGKQLTQQARAEGGFAISDYGVFEQTGFKLTLQANLTERLSIDVQYQTDKFERPVIARLLGHLQSLLGFIAEHHDAPLAQLPYLTLAEKNQQFKQFNDTDYSLPDKSCLHQLFERQVALNPGATAVVFEQQQLSYSELNARANRLAHYLQHCGVAPEVKVGLCAERGIEMLTGLLAILKAGGAYVPIDPKYPAQRIDYLIQNSRLDWVLTTSQTLERLPAEIAQKSITFLAVDDNALSAGYSEENLQSNVQGDNLGYVIYTSGSTGKPKGVEICHRSAVSLMSWAAQLLTDQQRQGMLAATSVCFDLSVYELFVPLISGGRILLIDNILQLHEMPAKDQVRLINTVPSAAKALLDSGAIGEQVEIINLAGEALKSALVNNLYRHSRITEVADWYGPSEATTYSTRGVRQCEGIETIGKPVANTQCYILDDNLEPMSLGLTGQLYIAGTGLARGYTGHPALTAASFVPNPFSDVPGARLYRTGDLARYGENGDIEYLGRVDHQVKVRGFRIELGEIESLLLEQPELLDVVASVRDDSRGGAYIVAYCVAQKGHMLEQQQKARLKALCQQRLPEYMVPSAFVVLDSLPLTSNGKVDHKALPKPQLEAQQVRYLAPASDTEKALCAIWQEVLGKPRIGIEDNFFSSGGDSILSIQVVVKAKAQDLVFSVRDIFDFPTIAQLALQVKSSSRHFSQADSCGLMPMLPIHQRFFNKTTADPAHYLQSAILQTPEGLDIAFVKAYIEAVYRRHDALRLCYRKVDGDYQGHFVELDEDWLEHSLQVFDLSDGSLDLYQQQLKQQAESTKAEFDLEKGPLFKVVLFNGIRQRLLIAAHHLVIDGVSWRILLQNLNQAYRQWCKDEQINLGLKTSSYQDWTLKLQETRITDQLNAERGFWLEQLKSGVGLFPVDFDHEQPPLWGNTESVKVSLDETLTEQLLQQCNQAYRTQIQELLMAALLLAFNRFSGESFLALELEGHGREHDLLQQVDVSETVGWFTNLYPLLLRMTDAQGKPIEFMDELIKSVKEQNRRIPNSGMGYGVLRHLAKDPEMAALKKVQSPQVMLNYLGQFDGQNNADMAFIPVSEETGSDVDAKRPRDHLLDIVALVQNGQLEFNLEYSPECHTRDTLSAFAEELKVALEQLIEHCLSVRQGSYTPSDFPLAQLEQQEFDDIQAQLFEELGLDDELDMDIDNMSEEQAQALLEQLNSEL